LYSGIRCYPKDVDSVTAHVACEKKGKSAKECEKGRGRSTTHLETLLLSTSSSTHAIPLDTVPTFLELFERKRKRGKEKKEKKGPKSQS
jgi:hypothetical protein